MSQSPTQPVFDGMGAIVGPDGCGFRVWAPHASAVSVVGDFNAWAADADPLAGEGNGYWYGYVSGAGVGHAYRYSLTHGDETFTRVDPYALEVTNSVGNGVICDADGFDWEGDQAHWPPHHELVIYELHIGTFAPDLGVGDFADAVGKLDYLKELGVNAIEIMPISEFAGDLSWGYNPAHIFAVESAYGGPDAFKTLVKEAHRRGIAVIQDVVYNHFGPSDLNLWRFDGWSENDKGGIYFYNDERSATPWGDTRPDYGREEVRRFIRDNALLWLREYHVDGLRLDMTPYMRSVDGNGFGLEEGMSLMRWITDSVREEFPGRIVIAEDLHGHDRMTGQASDAAGFHAQWDAAFVHPVRAAIIVADDDQRSMGSVADAVRHAFNGDALQRVIYTESHDEVANGSARVPHEIDAADETGWWAQKRSTLGGGLVMTAPGVPMIFQGQEALEGGWFSDDDPLDWLRADDFHGIARLYQDLIDLRLNRGGVTRGLTGSGLNVFHVDEDAKVIAFQRWAEHGPGDDVVVVANFHRDARERYRIGWPAGGLWKLRFNSDASSYSAAFGDFPTFDVEPFTEDEDGLAFHTDLSIGPYSLLIYSQDA